MGFIQPVEDELGQLADGELLLMFEEHPDEFTPQELLWAMNHDNENVRVEAAANWGRRPFGEKTLLYEFTMNPYVPENFLLSVLRTEYSRQVPLSSAMTVKVADEILNKRNGFKTSEINKLARNRSTPVETLLKLVKRNVSTRRAVATNPNLPAEVLRDLMLGQKCSANVARNPALREDDILDFLLNHKSKLTPHIEEQLILHKNISPESLKATYYDSPVDKSKNVFFSGIFLHNAKTPSEVLEHLTEQFFFSSNYYKMEALLVHPNLTERSLRNFMIQSVELTPKVKKLLISAARKLFPEYAGYPHEWVAVSLGME